MSPRRVGVWSTGDEKFHDESRRVTALSRTSSEVAMLDLIKPNSSEADI